MVNPAVVPLVKLRGKRDGIRTKLYSTVPAQSVGNDRSLSSLPFTKRCGRLYTDYNRAQSSHLILGPSSFAKTFMSLSNLPLSS